MIPVTLNSDRVTMADLVVPNAVPAGRALVIIDGPATVNAGVVIVEVDAVTDRIDERHGAPEIDRFDHDGVAISAVIVANVSGTAAGDQECGKNIGSVSHS